MCGESLNSAFERAAKRHEAGFGSGMNGIGGGEAPNRDEAGLPGVRRSWRAGVAVFAAVLMILGAGTLAGTFASELFGQWVGAGAPGARPAGAAEALSAARLAVFLVALQAVSVLLTIPTAKFFETPNRRLLPFDWPKHGGRIILVSVIALFLLMWLVGSVALYFDRDAFVGDVKPFADMAKTRVWWALMIGAAIGAPIAEELLFRGLFFGVLRDTRLGLFGTTILTAAMWSMLHMQYSLYGLVAIFCIGLYLGWLRERTGSLIPPMIVHGLYNGTIVAALAFLTEGGAAAVR